MKKSNLLQILSGFTPAEVKDFNEYVRSPFFNKNTGVIKLFEYLRRQYPQFKDEKVLKKEIYSHMFPAAAYNDGQLRILMFTLTNLATDFLAYNEFKQDKIFESNLTLKTLNARGLYKQFEKLKRQVSDSLNKTNVKHEKFYYNSFHFEMESLLALHRTNFDRIEKFLYNKGVNNIIFSLSSYYVIWMFRFYLYSLNIRSLYNIQVDTKQMDALLKSIVIDDYKDSPLIPILYNTIMLHLEEQNESHFNEIKHELKNFEKFSPTDSVEILINMENYCKRKLRNGRLSYRRELFNLYKFEIENKIYLAEGCMTEKMYIGVVETALELKEYQWTKKFINDYRKELPELVREDSYKYTMAMYEFAVKNFHKAVELLSKTKYGEVFNKFGIKTLLIASYYELGLFDQMEAVIDSCRHLIASDKFILGERKKFYSNFLRIAKRMILIKTAFKAEAVNEVRKFMKTSGFVVLAPWITEKLEEAEKLNAS